jgi:hypothetical protein
VTLTGRRPFRTLPRPGAGRFPQQKVFKDKLPFAGDEWSTANIACRFEIDDSRLCFCSDDLVQGIAVWATEKRRFIRIRHECAATFSGRMTVRQRPSCDEDHISSTAISIGDVRPCGVHDAHGRHSPTSPSFGGTPPHPRRGAEDSREHRQAAGDVAAILTRLRRGASCGGSLVSEARPDR